MALERPRSRGKLGATALAASMAANAALGTAFLRERSQRDQTNALTRKWAEATSQLQRERDAEINFRKGDASRLLELARRHDDGLEKRAIEEQIELRRKFRAGKATSSDGERANFLIARMQAAQDLYDFLGRGRDSTRIQGALRDLVTDKLSSDLRPKRAQRSR